ncbi:MAG: ABC transporter ATP-binding protein [Clostridium sp.]
MNTVVFEDVKKVYNRFQLKIPKLEIKKGYITGFIGPNGSGKTTTIKLIMNMIKKDNGRVEVFGQDSVKSEMKIKEEIGYVGDIPGFIEENTLRDIKSYVKIFYNNWDDVLYNTLISRFKLNEKSRFDQLSKGMRKQFELALALAHHPKFLIMDEPTANLDPLVRNEFLEILLDYIQNEECTIFYSSHITTDLEKACDYIYFIYDGEIILHGEKDEIISSHIIVKGKKELLMFGGVIIPLLTYGLSYLICSSALNNKDI